jgi:heat shock protein HslJ
MKQILSFSTLTLLLLTALAFSCATAKVSPSADAALEGTDAGLEGAWTLEQFLSEGSLTAIPAEVKAPELTFAADGRLSGFAGVNVLTSSWSVTPKTHSLTISRAATTRKMALSMEANTTENIFLTRLNEVRTYDIEAAKLLLKGGAGQVLLVFSKAN